MKKTLTVNLAGTVFHIDDDAYRLLDNYLNNLRLYFQKQEGAQEIVDDIENRVCELFLERIDKGQQVITIANVEEVIARLGKPEDFEMADDNQTEQEDKSTKRENNSYSTYAKTERRLYRDPDNKILGGVFSGMAAYLGWDVTLIRLIAIIILIFGYGVLIPIYIICWLVIPEARTAPEKLAMRGEEVNMENIGKTVTDGFEKAVNGVNDFVNSDKPRTFLQRLGDILVSIFGFLLKALLILLVVIFSPVLFVLALVFVVLIFVAIAALVTGGAFLMQLPIAEFMPMTSVSPMMSIAGTISAIVVIGVPIGGIIYAILSSIFNWSPMATGLKWALFILWAIGLGLVIANLSMVDWNFYNLGLHSLF